MNIDDADLPGDLLFFNYCHRKGTLPSFCAAESDGKVLLDADHEAIYIGSFGGGCTLPDGSTGDVIQASGLPIAHGTAGVICSKKSTMVSYAQSIGAFKGFGRRVPAKVGIRFATGSPVSLRVTDPQGFTIDGTTELTTDFEILHEVPGQLYYSHLSTQNGTVDDVVVGPTLKAGAYSVKVIAKPDALPTDTYSLTVDAGGSSLSLASNVLISAIPSGGYTLASTGSTAQTCDVTYNGTFNGNLTISRGVTCVSNGTITGNLTQEGGGLFVRGATIAGNLRINSGIFSIGAGTTIKGNLQIQNIPAGSTGAQICGATVNGNLMLQNNEIAVALGTPSTSCAGDIIRGNLLIASNSAPIGVFNNSVSGNLQCQNNSAITGSGNIAAKKQGQCSSF